MYYSKQHIENFMEGHDKIQEQYYLTTKSYSQFLFKNSSAREYAYHGFMRRLGILKRCIENVYDICPPARSERPSREEILDLDINLQCFIANVYGCIDNLAWVWTKENNIKNKNGQALSGKSVGLMCKRQHKIVRQSLSEEFQKYLDNFEKWYRDYLEDFRHALAHRIPLYVPPYCIDPKNQKAYELLEGKKTEALELIDFKTYSQLDAQQHDLGFFRPWMTHSFSESKGTIIFHSQMLSDWNTIIELSERFLQELNTIKVSKRA